MLRVRVGVARPGPTHPTISGCLADKDSIPRDRKIMPFLTTSGSGFPELLIATAPRRTCGLRAPSPANGFGKGALAPVIRAVFMLLRELQQPGARPAPPPDVFSPGGVGPQLPPPIPPGMFGC